jgi:hypothetical protein
MRFAVRLVGGFLSVLFVPFAYSQSLSVTPSSLTFSNQAVGSTSSAKTVTVTNTGTSSVTISAVTITPTEFTLASGGPVVLAAGASTQYKVKFSPDAVQTFSGQLTLTISGSSSATVVPLTGNGALASISVFPTSLTFAGQPLGTTSAPQTVTITNTGGANVTVKLPYVTPPFVVSGFTKAVTLTAGKSTTIPVSLFGTFVGSYTGTLNIPFDVLPNQGVSLAGSATNATSLAINTFASLPVATQAGPYLATLLAAGGTGGLTWQLASGSSLPLGLSLSSSGQLSGTVDASVALGSHSFTVQVTDSNAPPSTASENMTLSVMAQTGANCADIIFNVPNTNVPLVPITDLGTGTYMGYEGGLYPNGSNTRPAAHDAAGVSIADSIQPLDANGLPSPTGLYAMVSLGPSDTQQEFIEFTTLADAEPAKNSHLVLVNGAQPRGVATLWADPNSTFWSTLMSTILPAAGVTADQVVVAWVQTLDLGIRGTYPKDMTTTQADLESVARTLLTKFPNLKIAYYTSRIYGGYGNGVNTYDPEPFAYDLGWAVKGVIQDQINGVSTLNYNPNNGPVVAPWLAWGPYYWANGLLARNDGLVWACPELKNDGLHPENPLGREKVASALLDFLKTDTTATPWFLAH